MSGTLQKSYLYDKMTSCWPKSLKSSLNEEEIDAGSNNERIAGSWGAFRPPEQTVEPENAKVYLFRAQRYPCDRPAQDHPADRKSLRVHQAGVGRRDRSFCGDQETGYGGDRRRSQTLQHVLCQPALDGRDPHQL